MSVESFATLIAAIGMVAVGIVIFYNWYQSLMHLHEAIKKVVTNSMILVFSSTTLSNLVNYVIMIIKTNS